MNSESEKLLVTGIVIMVFVAWTVAISFIFYIAGCYDQTKQTQKEAVLKGAPSTLSMNPETRYFSGRKANETEN